MFKSIFIFITFFTFTNCALTSIDKEMVSYYQIETTKSYEDVLTEMEVAIAENNFRITGHSRVGKVIRERGTQNFPEYDTIQFCNLSYAKILLDIEPQSIIYMPCNIVSYQFNDKTFIKTHLLPENTENIKFNEFAQYINQLLKKIVDFAAKP